jgi:predicted NBD/HSP70 family sugar kinase
MAETRGVYAQLRRAHEQRVLRVLRTQGALSRAQISARVGLSRTAVSEITAVLLRRGAIVVVDTDAPLRRGSGRPAERLAVDPGSGQFLGVDFGHARVRIAIADAAHEVVATGTADYADAPWSNRIQIALELGDKVCAEHGLHLRALHGIGIGVPGPHPTHSHLDGSRIGSVAGFHEPVADVIAAFEQHYGAEVIVDNNTRFAALGEAVVDEKAVRDLIYVRLSDGVGGGLVLDGRLFTGSEGIAGELGHVCVDPAGPECRCGKFGCLETFASVPAILAECRVRGVEVTDLTGLEALVQRSHPVVDQVLRDAATRVGRVLGAVAMAINPEQIVVGGRITRVAPVIVAQVASTVAFEMFPGPTAPTVRAALDVDGDGARGALAALFHRSPLLAGHQEADGSSQFDNPTRSKE